MSQSRLFVGNLPFSLTDQDLAAAFSGVGPVLKATVLRDKETGKARGFGFVEMASDEDAQTAIDQLHETTLGGRRITVNVARPREHDRRHGGGSRHAHAGGHGGPGGRAQREPRW